jgi:hypothetical protein
VGREGAVLHRPIYCLGAPVQNCRTRHSLGIDILNTYDTSFNFQVSIKFY